MHVINHNWSAMKQHLHPQSVAKIRQQTTFTALSAGQHVLDCHVATEGTAHPPMCRSCAKLHWPACHQTIVTLWPQNHLLLAHSRNISIVSETWQYWWPGHLYGKVRHIYRTSCLNLSNDIWDNSYLAFKVLKEWHTEGEQINSNPSSPFACCLCQKPFLS